MSGDAWFKPQPVGYGNVPINWKGWACTLGFTAFVFAIVVLARTDHLSKLWAIVIVLALTAVYLPFIRAKTSGEWRWRSRADQH